jgi:aminoglycoside phosphotransferase (APT) family kinase protein
MTDAAEGPLVDEPRLRAFLAERLGPAARFHVERHRAGHSNETFFVAWGERELVLRRPPRGAFLPTAHDVLREHRILSGLEGSRVRAPRPVLACEDASVLGAPFYLMERARGVVLRDEPPADPAARRAIGEELVDALADLHAFAWRGSPLAALGKPDGYLERQVRRWTGQMEATLPWTQNVRAVPELAEAGKWLAEHVPAARRATLVHGDYKLDNVLFELGARGDGARLTAILDWEMSTIGDPLADLGWMLSFWREAGDPPPLPIEPRVTEAPGFLRRCDLVERYEARAGFEVGDLRYYTVLAVWKLAILLEGSYARHLLGATDDPFFAHMERAVPALARRALDVATASG